MLNRINKEKINIISKRVEKLGKNNSQVTICTCECLLDGHIWDSRWANLSQGYGCPRCAGQIVTEENSIRAMRPDLIKYLECEGDADLYAFSSNKSINLICPECGTPKNNMNPNRLSWDGFHCPICSDGISIPEKFGIEILSRLNVKFELQKIFNWSQKKRYDFYISELNMIIEAHGGQHYQYSNNKFTRTLEEEQENDALKERIAKENGITQYLVIDCRKSELEWLRNNYTKTLETYFNISDIDWITAWEKTQSSLKVKIWDAWNNRSCMDNVVSIGKEFNLSGDAVRKYLKIGTFLNKCEYNGKEESQKSKTMKKPQIAKPVYQYDRNLNLINIWESQQEARQVLNINNISTCCHGRQKSSGGFIWSHTQLTLT